VLPHEIYEQRAFGIKASLRVIYRCPKKIIVHSQYSKDRLISLFKVLPEKIEVIYHGNYLFVRTKELSPEHAKEILGIPQNKKVILQFGTIRQYKGLDTLIHAFKRIRERTGNVFLLTVGKPFNTDITYFKNLINELNLTDDVILKDQYVPLEEIPSYFFASDLVVFPYKEIDMSGSLQLAYAFSKPVIAAKVGGLAEVVEDGKNGVFVEPDNIDALEKAMEKILFQDELMKKMGDFSFDLARKKFSWEKIANDTINLYRNALDQ
jgi:glycosyltransferase involved in cell wall biosynthesis